MELKQLADQLREGHLWQLANACVLQHASGTVVADDEHVEVVICKREFRDKAKADDFALLEAASTCAGCGGSVSHEEIHATVAEATDMKSFLRLILEKIEHADRCNA